MIRLRGLKKEADGRIILDVPELPLREGTICALIGANGSGKTTLARLAAGVMPSDTGRPCIDRAISVGYLPQHPMAFRMTTVENLRLNAPKDGDRSDELLAAFRLTSLAQTPGRKLSGGERGRMALARLMMRPYRLLILDEPTASMDAEMTMLVEHAVDHYRRETGAAVLLITHALNQAKRLSDELIYLQSGRIIERNCTEELLTHPQDERTKKYIDFYRI